MSTATTSRLTAEITAALQIHSDERRNSVLQSIAGPSNTPVHRVKLPRAAALAPQVAPCPHRQQARVPYDCACEC